MKYTESFCKELFENIYNGLAYHKIITDNDNNPIDYEFIEVNNAYENLTGLKKENIIGKTASLICPDLLKTKKNLLAIYGNIALNGGKKCLEDYSVELNKWYRLSVYSPQKQHFITILDDITDIKQKESQHKILFETASIGTFRSTPDGKLLDINPSFAHMFGYETPDELLKSVKNEMDLYLDPGMRQEHLDSMISNDKDTAKFEVIFVKMDKESEFTASVNLSLIRDDSDQIVYIEGFAEDISEHKQIEYELNKSNHRLEFVLDNIPHRIFVKDNNLNYIWCNKNLAKDAGLNTPAEIIGKMDFQLAWSGMTELYKQEDEDIIKFQKPQINIEEIHTLPDETLQCIKKTKMPLIDEDKSVIGIIGIYEDITYLKQMQINLKESEDKLNTIFQVAPEAILVTEIDGNIIDCNEEAMKLYGTSDKHAFLGKNMFDFIIPEDKEMALSRIKKTIKTGFLKRNEYTARKADSSLAYLEVSASVIRDNTETAKYIIAVVRDITQRKKSEEELKQREEQLRLITDNMADIIMQIDANYNLIYISPSVKKILGYDPDLLKNKSILKFIHKDDLINLSNIKDIACKEFRLELRCRNTKNEYIWIESEIQPFYDEFLKFSGAILSCRDISGRKDMENERIYLLNKLEEKNLELENIIYVASHDIRSPLVNIHGFSQELQHSFNDFKDLIHDNTPSVSMNDKLVAIREEINESINYISSSVIRIDKLITGLLKLSRIGKDSLKIKEIDMTDLVNNLKDSFEFRINQMGVTLQIDKLPSCYTDEVMISQIVSNLLDNALKYLDPQKHGIIRITGYMKEPSAIYCIEDNGIGIDEKYLSKIFNIFYRLNPKQGNGEGLGLTIIQKILFMLEGKIWVESEAGKGSKFYFSLPNHYYNNNH